MRGYAAATVDDRWQAQLSALDARVWWAGGDGYLQARGDRDGLDRLAVIVRALDVIYALGTLPRLPLLCPPPGQARAGTGTRTGAAARPRSPPSRAPAERRLPRLLAALAKA